jgi:hypothetical protein
MDLTILIVCAAGSLLPCVGLWIADQRDRRRRAA